MKFFRSIVYAIIIISASKAFATTVNSYALTAKAVYRPGAIHVTQSNGILQRGSATKFVKDLNEEELSAYKILKKLISDESVDKRKIIFFYKVDLLKKEGLFEISTKAQTQFAGFKSSSGSKVIEYSIILKNRIEQEPGLPKDSVFIGKTIAYQPEYKTKDIAKCGKFEWEIYNRGRRYETRDTLNINYAIKNPERFQYIYYADKVYAIVKEHGKYGVLDKDSKVLLPTKFSLIEKNEFGLLIHDNNSYYYINPVTGKKLSKDYFGPNMTAIYKLKQNLFAAMRNGKMTLLNSKFEEIVPPIYDNFSIRSMGKDKVLIARKVDKWVVIDPATGKETGDFVQ